MDRSCYCLWDLQSTDRFPALQEMLALVTQLGEHSRELLLRALETRELAGATVVAPGVSMPHCRSILVDDFVIVVGRSGKGVGWPDEPVKLVILFISPVKPSGPQEHMDLIKHLAGRLGENGPEKLFAAAGAGQLAQLLGFQLAEGGADASGS